MSSTEDLAVSVLRGTVEACHGWPDDDRWVAMASWRQEPVGAVLVGRRHQDGEVFYDVVTCKQDGDEWYALGSGGSSFYLADSPRFGPDKVCWFYSHDVVFEQENGEEAYVSSFVGVAAPEVERLTLRFSNGSQVETKVISDDRLVFAATISRADEDLTVQIG